MLKEKRTRALFTLVSLSILTALLVAWAPAAFGLTVSQAPSTGTRIRFPQGGTSATVRGTLAPNAVDHYVFGALAGQILTLQIATGQGKVVVSLSGADNALLLSDYVSNSTFTGALPSTQDYRLDVRSAGQGTAQYSLTVTIPPLKTPPPSGAQRIEFAPGATSATVQGQLPAGGSQTYVLGLLAHQLVQWSVFPEQGVGSSLRGADGAGLTPVPNTANRGYVPTTQDYFLTVTAQGAAVSYTLQVFVPARIAFTPGATSGTVQGVLAPQTQGHYIVGASVGQTLNVATHVSQGEVILVIYGVDGTVMISDHAGATDFTGTLPFTEDYLIDVLSVGSQSAVFSMTVTIPPK